VCKRLIVVMSAVATLIAASVEVAHLAEDVVQAAASSLVSGNVGHLVALFRYFDETVPSSESARDRQVLRTFFTLLLDDFGRPEPLQPTRSTAGSFVNIHMESATTDLWRNSDCVFKSYAFQTHFVRHGAPRSAEVMFDACLDSRQRPTWLRKIDVHFSNPDAEMVAQAQAFFQRLQAEIRKIGKPTT
jgi:hypothetical protein